MQQSKARMTFRFDTANKTVQPPQSPSPQERQLAEISAETAGFPTGASVLPKEQDEIAALEEMIRQSEPVPESLRAANGPRATTKKSSAIESDTVPTNLDKNAAEKEIGRNAKRPITVLVDDDSNSSLDYPESELGPRLYPIRPIIDEEHWPMEKRAEDDAKRNVRWLGGAAIRSDGPSWWRVFVSVAGAIVTGALFGYLVLSLFTGEPLFSGKAAEPSGQQASNSDAVPAQAQPTDSLKPEGAQEGSNGLAAATEIAGEAYYLLQYGVFRTPESRDTAVGQLEELGLPAASSVDSQEGLHVYAGIALTKEDAEQASASLSASGVELYVKRLETEPLTLSRGADSDAWAAFLNGSAGLEKKLIQLTADRLQADTLTAIAAQEQEELQAAYDKLAADWGAAKKLQGTAKEHADSIVEQLGAAVRELAEYKEKPALNKLREVQSALMQAVIADLDLRQSVQSAEAG